MQTNLTIKSYEFVKSSHQQQTRAKIIKWRLNKNNMLFGTTIQNIFFWF